MFNKFHSVIFFSPVTNECDLFMTEGVLLEKNEIGVLLEYDKGISQAS